VDRLAREPALQGLEGGKAETLGFGNPGGQTNLPIIDFSSDGGSLNNKLDFANGFGSITPSYGLSTSMASTSRCRDSPSPTSRSTCS
jgi:hypothetical protein